MMRTRLPRMILLVLSFVLALPGPVAHAQVATETPIRPDGVTWLTTTPQETVLEMATATYSLTEHQGVDGPCLRLEIPRGEIAGDSGTPGLPARSLAVGLPPQATPQVTVTPLEELVISDVDLCPAPRVIRSEDQAGGIALLEADAPRDAQVYTQDRWWPADLAQIGQVGYLRSQRLAAVTVWPFRYNPARRTLVYYPRLQVRISHPGGALQRATTVSEPQEVERLLQAHLVNYPVARAWRELPTQAAAGGWMPPLPALRIGVRGEGIYTVTYQDLRDAGLDPVSIPAHTFRLFHNGQEVPLRLVDGQGRDDTDNILGPGDVILFYAQGVDEKYTDTDVYWLSYGGQVGGIRMVTKPTSIPPNAVDATWYWAHVRVEENVAYISSIPRKENADHWYGRRILALGPGGQGSQSYTVPVANRATQVLTATVSVSAVSIINGPHHLRIAVNGTPVKDTTWDGATDHTVQATFDAGLLQEGDNTVSLILINDGPDQTIDMAYLDHIELTYAREYVAQNDQIILVSAPAGRWQYTLRGFTPTARVEAYDVTSPERPARLASQGVNGVIIIGSIESESRRYVVLTSKAWKRPAYVSPADTVNLRATDRGADYILITHRAFWDAAQRLAAHRAQQGLRVQVVDVQHIYDQFSYGRVSVEAIRDFLAYAYTNWKPPAPQYVLLLGDGTQDPKGYLPNGAPTFIPPYLAMVDPDLGETAADNRFVTIVGDDLLPDMHLGRIPVETLEQAQAVVDKILAYESTPQNAAWTRNLIFVADNLVGGGGAFYNFSDRVAEGVLEGRGTPLIPQAFTKAKLYLDRTCNGGAACKDRLIQGMNQGALFVSYVGHASIDFWAEERLLDLNSLERLTNGDRLSIMLPMTCLEGSYQQAEVGKVALGEALIRAADRGAVASWSPTGLGLVSGHDYLERGFVEAVFYQGVRRVGPATTAGKLTLVTESPAGKYLDLLDTFVLLGDPATRIPIGDTPGYRLFLPRVNR